MSNPCKIGLPIDSLAVIALRTRVGNIAGLQDVMEVCHLVANNLVECGTAFVFDHHRKKIRFRNLDASHPAAETALLLFGLTPKEVQLAWLTVHARLRFDAATSFRSMTAETLQLFIVHCLDKHPQLGWNY